MMTVTEKRAYRREWYQRNKKRNTAYILGWNKRNPDKIRLYKQRYYAKNKKKFNKLSLLYYHKHKYRRGLVNKPGVKTNLSIITDCGVMYLRKLKTILKANDFYSTRNLQKILGFSRQWIYELRRREAISYWIYHGRVYYPKRFWRNRNYKRL